MKTSINFKEAKADSEVHNFRKKSFDYIRKELTPTNEYWRIQSIAERRKNIENYCKEKSGRKLQKNVMPIREAVVVTKTDTTMRELHDLSKKLEDELGIRVFQIAVHKDEGHYDKETKIWKPNYHAHLVADWQDLKTGKTLKHKSHHYSKMQNIAAECLGMERGISGSPSRLEAVEFKIKKREEDLQIMEDKYSKMKSELDSENSENLVVKESNFLAYQRINTEKTIENFEKSLKVAKRKFLDSEAKLKSKSEQVEQLQSEISDLKKEVTHLKNKNLFLLNGPEFLASEKKKYQDSVLWTLENYIKSVRFVRYQDTPSHEEMKERLIKVIEKVSTENKIPAAAFNEIFRDKDKTAKIFNLMRFGEDGERKRGLGR